MFGARRGPALAQFEFDFRDKPMLVKDSPAKVCRKKMTCSLGQRSTQWNWLEELVRGTLTIKFLTKFTK